MKVLSLLEEAVRRHAENTMNELEEQGMIKRFEFTYELAWNVLRDYFEYQINAGISGPRDAFREAFHKNLIDDGDGWMEMIRSRNLSSHTYSEDIAKGLIDKNSELIYSSFYCIKRKDESDPISQLQCLG
ncbi:MAG: nucleotidyltransferase substrate binding protein [Lentimicrobiaceae bacterium]|nr:nucleotidyltransferase substrate binding protein [Lentimicrobiaceae bacterium]